MNLYPGTIQNIYCETILSLDCGAALSLDYGTILSFYGESVLNLNFRALLNYKVTLFTLKINTSNTICRGKHFLTHTMAIIFFIPPQNMKNPKFQREKDHC